MIRQRRITGNETKPIKKMNKSSLLELEPYNPDETYESKKKMRQIGNDIPGRKDIPKGFVLQHGALFEGTAPEGHSQPCVFQDGEDGATALMAWEYQFRELLAVKSDDAGRQDIPRNSEGLPFFHGNAPYGHSQPWVFTNCN